MLYLNINEVSENTTIPINSSGIYINTSGNSIDLILSSDSNKKRTLTGYSSMLVYTSNREIYSFASVPETESVSETESVQETESVLIIFDIPFGGVVFDGSQYWFPTNAQPWAGFGTSCSNYPLSFPKGGSITFHAYAQDYDIDVRFRFEFHPFQDVDPDVDPSYFPDTESSYDTSPITINSIDFQSYTIDIPPQGENTFSSIILYIIQRDRIVYITDINININL